MHLQKDKFGNTGQLCTVVQCSVTDNLD